MRSNIRNINRMKQELVKPEFSQTKDKHKRKQAKGKWCKNGENQEK